MTTDATGAISSITPDPEAEAQAARCSSAYHGAIGSSACDAIISYAPLDEPLLGNKTYTAVAVACVIRCGASNTCPGALRCDAASGWCLPVR